MVEYYIDTYKKQYCFVVHLWGNYWIDYNEGTSKYRDAIYCTTYYLNEAEKLGNLIYEDDSELGSTHERVYDAQGKLMADITYEYIPGIPLPFITEHWNLDTGYELVDVALCRNQKSWLYKDQALFDETGKFISYKEKLNRKDYNTYFSFPSVCVYDAEGRLNVIKEELQEEDIERGWGSWDESSDCSGQMKFDYDESGNVKAMDYFRSSYTHGTTDSSGTIEYDERGRMIYNQYYITHGGHTNIFLYDGDSERPWVCFYWCSFTPGFENVYMFQPINN